MKEEEVIKIAVVAILVWYFFLRDSKTYEVPMPGPAKIAPTSAYRAPVKMAKKVHMVNNPHLLANQSKYNSSPAYDGQTLYNADPRGAPSTVSGYKPKELAFSGPEGALGPVYPTASFRGIANAEERGPAPMPAPPVMGVTTAPAPMPIRVRNTNFDSSWTINRKPQ